MALIFAGDDGYDISGPPEWEPDTWGLDQLVIPYSGRYDDLETFLSAHAPGEASPIDANMFLMKKVSDQDRQFPTVRMVYQGKRGGTLPPQRHSKSNPIQSSTSTFGSFGPSPTPVTVQFHAPTNALSYITRTPGTTPADDPTDALVIIQITVGSEGFSGTSLSTAIARYFSELITGEIDSTEVVPGQYYQNVAKKTKAYVPFTFNLPSGSVFVTLSSPGSGYQIGDTLTVTGTTGAATLRVTFLGLAGSVAAYDTLTATFTGPESVLAATGGHGTGASFNVLIVP